MPVSIASITFATQDTCVCVGSEPSSCVCRAEEVTLLCRPTGCIRASPLLVSPLP
uniref:Uncharacterized protein n=1 Tax=Myoviridae sp. ctLIM9 TaxID=2827678 RepID=A0A8S5T6T6_9CAUD|nr:MAG TPA: hypothetical protein [Myoviridae sp. ctLIM9]